MDLLAKYLGFDAGKHLKEFSTIETCRVDAAYDKDAEAIVVRPEEDAGPAPVLLVLVGQGNVDGRQAMEGPFGFELLLRNQHIRTKFFLVVPKPSTQNGLVQYTGQGYKKKWAEDAVWALFTEILRRLGPERVDPAKLCCTGISMGAAGAWNLALQYGHMLSAVAPISGQCDWPGDTWPQSSDPDPEVMKRLQHLPMRAYQIDCDNYAGSPVRDIQWLTKGLALKTQEKKFNGQKPGSKIDVAVHSWTRPKGEGANWELYLAKGPLMDGLGDDPHDDHCLWWRAWPDMTWGLPSFLGSKTVPEERRWRFDSASVKVDSSEARNALRALWGEDFDVLPADPKATSEKEKAEEEGTVDRIISKEEELPGLMERMEKALKDALKKAGGRPIAVALRSVPHGARAEPPPAKAEEKPKEPDKETAKDPPKEKLTLSIDNGGPEPVKFDVDDNTDEFAVRVIMSGGDFLTAVAFRLALKASPRKEIPDGFKIRKEHTELCICKKQ